MEPERPIEKLLRAFAKKRRDDAGTPPRLHPATRRLLQGEVARQFGPAAQPARSRWQTALQLWPRFAWGLGALTVLALVAVLLLPSLDRRSSQATLARNEPLPEAASVRQPVPPATPPPSAAAPPVEAPREAPAAERMLANQPAASPPAATPSRNRARTEADKDQAVTSEDTAVREKLLATTPTLPDSRKQLEEAKAAGASSETSNLAATPEVYARRFGIARGGIATSPASPSSTASLPAERRPAAESQILAQRAITNQASLAANSPPLASWSSQSGPAPGGQSSQLFADAVRTDKGIAQAQSFVQEPSRTKTKAPRLAKTRAEKPILDSFQMVQLGQELRVIDRDGSVYIGNFQEAGVSPSGSTTQEPVLRKELRAPQQKLETSSALPNQQAAANYFFRVVGTNQSLKQKVVFTGNLLPATNQSVLSAATNQPSGAIGGAVVPQAISNLLPLPNSRISGKATIGDRQEIDVNATPAKNLPR